MDFIARDGSAEVVETICFLLYLMLTNISELVSDNSLYTLRDEWTELEKFCAQRVGLTLLHTALSKPVTRRLKMT